VLGRTVATDQCTDRESRSQDGQENAGHHEVSERLQGRQDQCTLSHGFESTMGLHPLFDPRMLAVVYLLWIYWLATTRQFTQKSMPGVSAIQKRPNWLQYTTGLYLSGVL